MSPETYCTCGHSLRAHATACSQCSCREYRAEKLPERTLEGFAL